MSKRVKIAIISVGIIILVLMGSVFYNRHEVYVSLQTEAKVLGIKEYSDPNLFLRQETLDNFEILINETIKYQKEQLKLIVETSDELEVDVTHIIEDDSLTDVEKYDLVYDEIITYLESEVSKLKNDIDKLLKKDLDYNSDEKSNLDKQKSLYNSLIKEELGDNNLIDNYTQNITILTKIKEDINSINTTTKDRLEKEEAERIAKEKEARQLASSQSYYNNSSANSLSSTNSNTSSGTNTNNSKNTTSNKEVVPEGCYETVYEVPHYIEGFHAMATDMALDTGYFHLAYNDKIDDMDLDFTVDGSTGQGYWNSDPECGYYYSAYMQIYDGNGMDTKNHMVVRWDGKVVYFKHE